MLNRVVLVGRLTKDPEIRYTANDNTPVASFTLAVSRQFSNKQTGEKEADFIPVSVWRKQAENVGKFVTKGSLVGVEGRIQTRSYDDKDGTRKYVTEVVADNVVFLESKGSSEERNTNGGSQEVKNDSKEEDERYQNITFSNNDYPF